jgi:hypothetical protein
MAKYKSDDVELLLPSFRVVYKKLLVRMVELGYDPIPFDTARTPEEALRNASKGVGILNSIHIYGAAADTICGKHGWSCASKKCQFFRALRREGLALGLFRGPEADLPHLQGLPATKKDQDALRALGAGPETEAARDALIKKWLRSA